MDSSTKQDLNNKFAVIFIGIIFAVLGFGIAYFMYFVGTVNIMLFLFTLLLGVAGICLFFYGIYTLVTGKECKIVEANNENESELAEEERQQIDMFVGEHRDAIKKIENAVYKINDIHSIISEIILGLMFVATISLFAVAFDLVSAIEQGDWGLLIICVVFLLIGLFNLIKGVVQLIQFIKK